MALLCPSRSTSRYPLETDEDALSLSLQRLEIASATNATDDQVEEFKCLLTTLPLEIQTEIYEYALAVRPITQPSANNAAIPFLGPVDPSKWIAVSKNAYSLLFTCRSISAVAYNIYIAHNTFLVRPEPYAASEPLFLVKYGDLIRSAAVEIYLEHLVWLANLHVIQDPTWQDELGPIHSGSRYHGPGIKYMKAVKAALVPLKKLKDVHVLVKGWSNGQGDMPFRFSSSLTLATLTVPGGLCLDQSALCIEELVEKWMDLVLDESYQADRPRLTLQIEAKWTNAEHRVLEGVWGDKYRCMKPIHWV